MKAYEFPATVTPEGKLDFPNALLKSLPSNTDVRVIILVHESTDQSEEEKSNWNRLAAEHFFADDGDADAIYDEI
ncbi:MAG: hypothetical protein GDA36_03945 [Rhodobacteraceae bacterium]|nr:hypothetical protein [Paracoccaceae bacterium]